MFLNHCHVFPHGAFPDQPELGTLPELDRFMREMGIERTVALAPFWGPRTKDCLDGEDCNDWLLRHLEDYGNIVAAAALNPAAPNAGQAVELRVKQGFVGVKTHPPVMRFRIDDERCDEFYSAAEELGVFVLYHTGVHGGRLSDYRPILIDNVLAKHPRLKVIIEHMGISGGIGRGFFDEAMSVVYNHSARWAAGGVYAGLTGMAKPQHRQVLSDAIREAGSDRAIFGLDWPHMEGHQKAIIRFELELDVLRSLRLTKEDEDNIFGRTLAALTRQ